MVTVHVCVPKVGKVSMLAIAVAVPPVLKLMLPYPAVVRVSVTAPLSQDSDPVEVLELAACHAMTM